MVQSGSRGAIREKNNRAKGWVDVERQVQRGDRGVVRKEGRKVRTRKGN